MTNSVICLLFLIADEYACGPGSDCVQGGVGAQTNMLNNGITSLTCIHREVGIKHSKRKKKNRNRREDRKDRIEMASEAIKNRSAAYLLKKWRPRGVEGRKEMRREAVVAKRGESSI